MKFKSILLIAVCSAFAPTLTDASAIDWLTTVVNNTNAVGGVPTSVSISGFGYDPDNDSIYVAGVAGADQQLRWISNLNGQQNVQTEVYETPWLMFTKAGNLDNGGGTPGPSGMLLNPKPIASLGIGAFSNMWIMDGNLAVTTGFPAVPQLASTQRIYRYNLETNTSGDARNEFTSVMTLDQYKTGAKATTNLSNAARQFAWSGDGQSIYFTDSNTAYGGLYRVSAAGGVPTKLASGSSDFNTEPAVVSSGGKDTIYLRGGSMNIGGIDKFVYDGTTLSQRTTALSAIGLANFFELSSASAVSVSSMTSDSKGNIFFADTGSTRKGLYCLDTSGRLFKVASYAERQNAFGNGNVVSFNMLRLQPRDTTFQQGSSKPFDVEQILYEESTPYNFIAGAFVFKPGDFNRDNAVDQSDLSLFKNALTIKGVATSTVNLKFDMNGNGEVSFQDVKILQQFDTFPDGDADMSGSVDLSDLRTEAADWARNNQTWIGGDFTGDGIVNSDDLAIMQANWQQTSMTFASALSEVGLTVPEPTVGLTMALTLMGLMQRNRRRLR